MKRNSIHLMANRLVLTIWAMLLGFWSFAQDAGGGGATSVSTTQSTASGTTTTENWYAAPWVWVVGAAVFILLLVAILNSGRGRRAD